MILELFPTKIGIYDFEDHESFNKKILSSNTNTHSRQANLWDFDIPIIQELKARVFSYAKELYPKINKVGRGWMNSYSDYEFTTPHSHPSAYAACAYYIKAEPNCGNLLLLDPAAGSQYVNYVEEDRGWDSRVYKSIEVKPGRLIIFPAHIIHMSEPNKSKTNRLVMSTNFLT